MRSIRFILLGFVCALLLASPAFADCKRCSGAYCVSVDDGVLGHDHCDLSTSQVTKWCGSVLNPQVCIEWTTNCSPQGDLCSNFHTSVTVDGGGIAGGIEVNNLNDLLCALGYASYWDCV